ncbi:hypothetical protein JY651_48095 [Pyxidicoccus parkwayensis]|uniref:Uncharacterized protein n=1 Tax=Pyxidicoccus parkwayensis TaxID=2813578 RepID=A0ABX7P1W5_9BACT|nr:hypothetical protein [Pyxidicoccus parkwaysis]QSQ22778.1 hypothetical protein JY651_48095 [Pyxidicoccus parkwaysis]
MFHPTVVIDDTGGADLHVGFVSCFGEPSVQWALVDAEGQLSGLGSIRVSKVEEFIEALRLASQQALANDPR